MRYSDDVLNDFSVISGSMDALTAMYRAGAIRTIEGRHAMASLALALGNALNDLGAVIGIIDR